MKFKLVIYIFLYIGLNFCSAANSEKIKLLWLTDDSRDVVNLLSKKQISIGSDTTNLVLNNLVHNTQGKFEFNFQLAQIPRINRILATVPNACVSNRIKTKQRDQKNLFSSPLNLYLSYRLYYLADQDDIPTNLLDDQQQLISLSALFNAFPNRILGLSKGQSYGKYLDAELSHLNPENIYQRPGEGRYDAIINMLLRHRIHYIITYPTTIENELNIENTNLPIKSIAIKGSPEYIVGRIACNKSATGQKVITEVNKILNKLYQEPAFYQAHTRYINETDIAIFNKYYQQVFHTLHIPDDNIYSNK